MQPYRQVQLCRHLKDRLVSRIVQWSSGNVGEYLHAARAKVLHSTPGFGNSRFGIVHVKRGYKCWKPVGVFCT